MDPPEQPPAADTGQARFTMTGVGGARLRASIAAHHGFPLSQRTGTNYTQER